MILKCVTQSSLISVLETKRSLLQVAHHLGSISLMVAWAKGEPVWEQTTHCSPCGFLARDLCNGAFYSTSEIKIWSDDPHWQGCCLCWV